VKTTREASNLSITSFCHPSRHSCETASSSASSQLEKKKKYKESSEKKETHIPRERGIERGEKEERKSCSCETVLECN